jgi:hypothetical protein
MPAGIIPAIPSPRLNYPAIERLSTKARKFGRRVASDLGTPVSLEALRQYVYEEGQKLIIEVQQARALAAGSR